MAFDFENSSIDTDVDNMLININNTVYRLLKNALEKHTDYTLSPNCGNNIQIIPNNLQKGKPIAESIMQMKSHFVIMYNAYKNYCKIFNIAGSFAVLDVGAGYNYYHILTNNDSEIFADRIDKFKSIEFKNYNIHAILCYISYLNTTTKLHNVPVLLGFDNPYINSYNNSIINIAKFTKKELLTFFNTILQNKDKFDNIKIDAFFYEYLCDCIKYRYKYTPDIKSALTLNEYNLYNACKILYNELLYVAYFEKINQNEIKDLSYNLQENILGMTSYNIL